MGSSEAFKKQHWIPTSYVRAWVDPTVPASKGPRVHVYDRDGLYLGWKYPKGVFAEPDLYTIQTSAGGRDVSIEKALGRIETTFAKTRRRLLAREPITAAHKGVSAAFVAALRIRSPAMDAHHANSWQAS